MMLLSIFFYYLKKDVDGKRNYWIPAFAAMLASCTRIVGVILVFPLVLGMYRDLYSGKISLKKAGSFIKDTLCTPVRMLQIFICPAGIFVNMLHLYWVCGDAWAFRHVQTAWREDGAGYIGNMIWDFFNNIYAERYWIPLVVILAIVVYVYMLRNGYYEEVLFAIITLIIPLTGGVMSMCRFIVGSYVIFIGIYDYLADKKDIKLCATALVVIMEAFLIWLWFTAGVNAFTALIQPVSMTEMRIYMKNKKIINVICYIITAALAVFYLATLVLGSKGRYHRSMICIMLMESFQSGRESMDLIITLEMLIYMIYQSLRSIRSFLKKKSYMEIHQEEMNRTMQIIMKPIKTAWNLTEIQP